MKPTETIDYHIKLLWHSISNLYNQLAQKFDLTQATGFVLLNIDKEKGTPATRIAPLMGMKATSLSRILKKMEEEGLIERKKGETDKRMVNIHLTDKGVEKQQIAKTVVREFNEYLLEQMKEEVVDSYFRSVKSINSITENYKLKKLG
jgi:DNA-binding MarR family transcriptional regulator